MGHVKVSEKYWHYEPSAKQLGYIRRIERDIGRSIFYGQTIKEAEEFIDENKCCVKWKKKNKKGV